MSPMFEHGHADPNTVVASPEHELPSTISDEFAPHFGVDLDDVQVASSRAHDVSVVGADALTRGDTIAFGESAYQPGSTWGRELIAHELAHVVQQRGGTGGPALSDPAALEAQADSAASAVLAGHAAPALSAAPAGAQPRVSMRDVGRGEQSGFDKVPELVRRMNGIASGIVFSLQQGANDRFQFLVYTRKDPPQPLNNFDTQMMGFIDDAPDHLMRFTNRHGLLEGGRHRFTHEERGRDVPNFVSVDAWQSGYVDIDDLLASSDLGLATSMVHQLRERQDTANYEHRIGIPANQRGGLDDESAEFDHAHTRGLNAELDLLKDFFHDPNIRPINLEARRFRSGRRDIIQEKETAGHRSEDSGVLAITWEVILHERPNDPPISAEAYKALLERERAAAP